MKSVNYIRKIDRAFSETCDTSSSSSLENTPPRRPVARNLFGIQGEGLAYPGSSLSPTVVLDSFIPSNAQSDKDE